MYTKTILIGLATVIGSSGGYIVVKADEGVMQENQRVCYVNAPICSFNIGDRVELNYVSGNGWGLYSINHAQ